MKGQGREGRPVPQCRGDALGTSAPLCSEAVLTLQSPAHMCENGCHFIKINFMSTLAAGCRARQLSSIAALGSLGAAWHYPGPRARGFLPDKGEVQASWGITAWRERPRLSPGTSHTWASAMALDIRRGCLQT